VQNLFFMLNNSFYRSEYDAVVRSLEHLKKILSGSREYTTEEDKAWYDFKIAVNNLEKVRHKRISEKTFDPDNPFN